VDEKYFLINLPFVDDQIIGNQRKISLFMTLNLVEQFDIKISLTRKMKTDLEEKYSQLENNLL
jgi:hypothetical protein